MGKDTCNIFWLVVFLFLAWAPWVSGAGPFLPVWQVGDRWIVKAVYHSHMNKDEWSQPVYWEYKIVSREGHGPGTYYTLEIKDLKAGLKLTTRLMYRPEDLSLARAEIIKTRRGKQIVKILTHEGGAPVATEQTLTPYDTPVFPLHSPFSTDFSVTKSVSQGLKATETVRQEVRQVRGIKEIPGWPEDQDLTEVKCTASDGTLIFVQYWDKNFPWPVFGQNRDMKYWLVKK